jgi:hypothetical protein
MKRLSEYRCSSTCGLVGFDVCFSGFTGAPVSSQAWKYLPSSARVTPSSRASTVLGCVPAAISTDLAARRMSFWNTTLLA